MRYQFYTADVFTDRAFGGNQLAVFPHAQGLNAEQMQSITREFNFSETVFVFPPNDSKHAKRLRIFTPAMELSFAGHPTIGAAHVLASIGQVNVTGEHAGFVFEENIGPVPVSVHTRDDLPVFAQLTAPQLPEFGPEPPSQAELASVLSLDLNDLEAADLKPQAVSCGGAFLFVPLRNRDALRRAKVDHARFEQVLSDYWTQLVYIFALDPELEGSDVRARMFAPTLGIEEDSATGSGAASLAGYLGVRDDKADETLKWRIEQGFEMGRPSILDIEADKQNSEITAIRVGGASVLVTEGTMDVPD